MPRTSIRSVSTPLLLPPPPPPSWLLLTTRASKPHASIASTTCSGLVAAPSNRTVAVSLSSATSAASTPGSALRSESMARGAWLGGACLPADVCVLPGNLREHCNTWCSQPRCRLHCNTNAVVDSPMGPITRTAAVTNHSNAGGW